uniref:DUF4283 domain-containing protein n=1 Tax=Quercus lobata TaxID=97700 RepID=A0A7N2LGZ3_QUELO
MAEDVINSLENMKLTTEEEEVITVPDEGRKDEIESCNLSLIGKFLTCKPFNKRAAQNTLRKAWGLDDRVQILEVGASLFQFKFQTEFDLDRVLSGGPWTFDNQALLLCKWQKGMTASNVKFDSLSLWVQIWGAPFDMFSTKVASEVGSRMGVVEEIEKRPKQEAQSLFMRVKVSLPLSKPLRRGGYIAGSDGGRSWVTFKYERLPMLCHYCGVLGHDTRHCAGHYAVLKNEKEVTCQYGDWLKSVGVRYASPSKKKPSQFSASENSGGDKMTAAVGVQTKNPTEGVNDEKGKSKDQGTGTNFQAVTNLSNEETTSVTDNISPINSETILEVPATRGELHAGGELTKNGPIVGNHTARPKWTRVIRMECGPRIAELCQRKEILGKRDSSQFNMQEAGDDEEMHVEKRGRVQDDQIHITAAGVPEHPCRSQ